MRYPALVLGLFVSLSAIGNTSNLYVGDASVTVTGPASQTLNFDVTATGDSTYDRYLSYRMGQTGDTAASPGDYTATTGVLKIPAGATSATIPVTIAGSSASGAQPDKAFTLKLSDAFGVGPGVSFPATPGNFSVGAGAAPHGVAVGDVNGDGKPDLVTANYQKATVSVLLNTTLPGDVTPAYAAAISFPVGGFNPASVAIGDLNGDGKLDLVAANYSSGSNSVSVLLNTTEAGDFTPTFAAPVAFPVANQPRSVAIGDFNGDGKPDLVTSSSTVSGGVTVLLNITEPGDLTPSFAAPANFGAGVGGVAIDDVNGDGKLDLVTISAGMVSVLLSTTETGDVTPTFAAAVDFPVGQQLGSLTTGDLNGDGKPDLVAANNNDNNVSVLINTTSAGAVTPTFAAASDFSVSDTPRSVVVGDVNGDGKPDLVTANSISDKVSVLINTTSAGAVTPTFAAASDFSVGDGPQSVAIGDVNGDGKPDLVTANNNGNNVSVLLNTTVLDSAPLAYTPLQTQTGSEIGFSLFLTADVDGDGRLDIIQNGPFAVRRNLTAPGAWTSNFAAPVDIMNPAPLQPFDAAVAADFNGDGKPDLAFAGSNYGSTITLLRNTTDPAVGTPSFATPTTAIVSVATHPLTTLAVADLNFDGKPDLLAGSTDDNKVYLLINTTPPGGALSFAYSGTTLLTSYIQSLAVGDLDGDGRPDVVVGFYDSVRIFRSTNQLGIPDFDPPIVEEAASGDLKLIDINGDGKLDIVGYLEQPGNVFGFWVRYNTTTNGTLSFAPLETITPGLSISGIDLADVNNDGKPDLLVVGNQRLDVLLNNTAPGSTTPNFVDTQHLPSATNFQFVHAADFNGDGQPDVLLGNPYGAREIAVALNARHQVTGAPATATGTIHYNLSSAVSANPGALDFGDQATGVASLVRTVAITDSVHTTPLSIGITGPDQALFSQTHNCTTSTSSCTVSVRFSPTSSGMRNATLTYSSGGGSVLVPLSGSGAALDLGSVNTGSTGTQTYTISNSSGNAVSLLTFLTSDGFTVVNNTCGAMLQSNSNCDVTIRYAPTQGGKDVGTLSYSRDGNTQSVALSGTGFGPIDVGCSADGSERVKELIRAVDRANTDLLHPQTIQLETGCLYSFTKSNQTEDADGSRFVFQGNNALPVILGTLTIEGNGAIIERSAGATGQFRLMATDADSTLALSRLTLRDGRAENGISANGRDGGAIYASGALTISNSTLSGNAAGDGIGSTDFHTGGRGGAIYANGALTISNSTLVANAAGNGSSKTGYNGDAGGNGGAIYNNGLIPTISNSTLLDNTAGAGGDSNIKGGNGGIGGAIYSDVGVRISNSTLTGNTSGQGGSGNPAGSSGGPSAIVTGLAGGTVRLDNSILSGASPICSHPQGSGGHNLVTDPSCGTGNLLVGSSVANTTALKLGPLQDNGGPTPTIALLPGSVAIDAGDAATCSAAPINNLDQRGIARPQGTACDIGAFEYVNTLAASPSSLSFGAQVVGVVSSAPKFVTLSNSGSSAVALNIPASSGDFTVDNTPVDRCGASLAGSGATCRVYVNFTPASSGDRSTTLSINSGQVVVNLGGSGTPHALSLTLTPGGPLQFSARSGNTTAVQTVTLKNAGNIGADLSKAISGTTADDAAVFALVTSGIATPVCGATLAAGASCNIGLQFTAPPVSVPTDYSASEQFTLSDPDGSYGTADASASLMLNGHAGASGLSISTPSDFGSVLVNSSSMPQSITLTRSGDISVMLSSIVAAGDGNAADFSVVSGGTCAMLLTDGSCTVNVVFSPHSAGSLSGTLTVMSDANSGAMLSVPLSGMGTVTQPDAFGFTPATDADPGSTQTSNAITVSGTNTGSAISIVGGSYRINAGSFTANTGTVQPGDMVTLQAIASSTYGASQTATLTIGGVSADFVVTTRAADVQAGGFSFTPVTNVARSTLVTSNSITVSGIEQAVPISISGGEYRITPAGGGAAGAYTSNAGTVSAGDSVTVQLSSSSNFSTPATATLTIGQGGDAVSADFTVTTLDAVTAPNPFGFGTRSDVARSSLQVSNDVTISGINTDAPVSVSGGKYSLDSGGSWHSDAGTIPPNGQVRVQVSASGQFATDATVTLTVGGVQGSFVVTTLAADTTPDAFSFAPVTGVPLSSVQTSSGQTVTGLNTDAPISVSGGSYSLDGGAFKSASGTIAPGQTVRVRQTASGSFSAQTTATLTIGGVAADFKITTLAAVTDPNAFSFGSVTDVPLNSLQTSGALTISGINTATSIHIDNGEYQINGAGFTSDDGNLSPGDQLVVRTIASGDFSTLSMATVTIGTVTGTYRVTTLAKDTTPDNFSFIGISGVNPSAVQTSDPVTISGINAPAPIHVDNGSYSLDDGEFTNADGTISNGQAVRVRTTASASYSTTTQAAVMIGGVSANFTVTTRDPVLKADAFSFTPQSDVARDTDIISAPATVSGIEVAVPITVAGGQYSLDGGAFTTAAGMVSPGQTVRLRVHSSNNFGMSVSATLTVGSGGDAVSANFTAATLGADTTPDTFGFTAVTGVEPNSAVTSNAVTISGLNTAAPISIVGGAYSIGCTGNFTSSGGNISDGQNVCVKLSASSNFSASSSTTLTIGGVSASFMATTRAASTAPMMFAFMPVNDAALDTSITSDPITVTGIEAPAAITVSGDNGAAFCINGNPCTNMIGTTVVAGDSVRVQVKSSAQFATGTMATVNIGGVSAAFVVATLAADTQPDAFSFTPVNDADPGATQISNAITVSGFNAASAISVSGGAYSIDGADFTTAAGSVQPGSSVRVATIASTSFAGSQTATLTIGGVHADFVVTTRAAAVQADGFTFTAITDVARSTRVTSNSITVSGIEAAVPISISGGEYSIDGGAYTATSGNVSNGQSVSVRVSSSPNFSTPATATLTIGQVGDAVSADFTVTTLAAITAPNPFGFGTRSDVALNSLQVSNDVTITGINTDAPVSVTGGEYSIGGGAWHSDAGTIAPDATVRVRVTAANALSAAATVTLNIGGVTGSFVVTTLAADTTPDVFAFGSVSDVPLSSVQTSAEVMITGINTETSVHIAGGRYSINGGAFTSSDGTIEFGDKVRVQLTASASFSTQTAVSLSIGGVSASFKATTLAGVSNPNAFSFGSVSDVPLSSLQTSGAVAITGINTATSIQISGGEYRINNGAFTTANAYVNPGDAVQVRSTASAEFGTTTTVSVDIGGVTGSYRITTLAKDTAPDSFSFIGIAGVNPSTVQTSDPVTITGINAPTSIHVDHGSYSLDGGPFTSIDGVIGSGQMLRVRTTASVQFTTTTQATVMIGGVSASFTVTTRDPAQKPNAFGFTPQTEVARDTDIISAPAAITGIEAAVPIKVSGGQYSLDGGAFTAAAGMVLPGQSVRLQVHSAAGFNAATTATLTIGAGNTAVVATFTVTTLVSDTVPDTFHFAPVTDVAPEETVTSAAIKVTGTNTASPISVSGGAYSIDGGPYIRNVGIVQPGSTVRLQLQASSNYSSAVQMTLIIGGVSADFIVNTTTDLPAVTVKQGGGAMGMGMLLLFGIAALHRRRRVLWPTVLLLSAFLSVPAQAGETPLTYVGGGLVRIFGGHGRTRRRP